MTPNWIREERRSAPSDSDFRAIVTHNIQELSRRVDEDHESVRENTFRIKSLDGKIGRVLEHVENHEADSKELIDSFRFSKRLRVVAYSIIGVLGAIFAVGHSGLEIIQHLKTLLSNGEA